MVVVATISGYIKSCYWHQPVASSLWYIDSDFSIKVDALQSTVPSVVSKYNNRLEGVGGLNTT